MDQLAKSYDAIILTSTRINEIANNEISKLKYVSVGTGEVGISMELYSSTRSNLDVVLCQSHRNSVEYRSH